MKRFTVKNVMTWGLVKDEDYGGYKLPVSFIDNQNEIDDVEKIVKTQKAKSPFYGSSKTIYFRLYEISEKQKEDLLDQKRVNIDLSFVVEDTPARSESKNLNYLRLRVTALKKSDIDESQVPSDEI